MITICCGIEEPPNYNFRCKLSKTNEITPSERGQCCLARRVVYYQTWKKVYYILSTPGFSLPSSASWFIIQDARLKFLLWNLFIFWAAADLLVLPKTSNSLASYSSTSQTVSDARNGVRFHLAGDDDPGGHVFRRSMCVSCWLSTFVQTAKWQTENWLRGTTRPTCIKGALAS